MASTCSPYSRQAGQAFAETLVGFVVIAMFLIGTNIVWRYAEMQQATVDAVRFAAWERVAWEPADNSVEKHALHKSDAALAQDTVLHQFSTPAAWRAHLAGISRTAVPAVRSADDRRATLTPAVKSFVSQGKDPNDTLSITTKSGWTNDIERAFRGKDPTLNTTTSLKLDKDTYRTVSLGFTSQLAPGVSSVLARFLLPPVTAHRHLSLITNTWAGSPPMNFIRSGVELGIFSPGDATSGTQPNRLAFFGLRSDPGAVTAGDFIGMVPWWNFVGGANGVGGQFIVRQIGLDAGVANSVLASWGQSYRYNPATPAQDLLLRAELQQAEYFNPSTMFNSNHRHTVVVDKTQESATEAEGGQKARNSNFGKRKYRAASLQNPVETFYVPR